MQTWLNLETKFLTRDLTWPFQKNLNLHFGFASGLFQNFKKNPSGLGSGLSAHPIPLLHYYYRTPDNTLRSLILERPKSGIFIRTVFGCFLSVLSGFSSGPCRQAIFIRTWDQAVRNIGYELENVRIHFRSASPAPRGKM